MPASFRLPALARLGLAALLGGALLSAAARADGLAEDEVKAGFILNFARYTEWPPARLAGKDLVICSLAALPLSGKLEALRGRQVQGRDVRVHAPARPGEWRECHVLFIPGSEAERLDLMLRTAGELPLLTIGDAEGFAQAGGMIGMFPVGGRIRFDINNGVAQRAGLKFSSQMLKLANEVLP